MVAVRQMGVLLRLVNSAVFLALDVADVVLGWLLRWLDAFLLPSCADTSCRCKQASHQAGQAVLYRSQGQDCGCWGLKSEVGGLALSAPGASGRPLVREGSQYIVDQRSARQEGGYPIRWTDCRCKACRAAHEGHQKAGHLFVRVEGAHDVPPVGADVIFLHGNLSSSNFWGDSVLPQLSPEFLSRHRVLLPDLLGLGRSPRPHACLYTIGEHLAALERSVLAAQGVGQFHLVGHSMGTLLCLALAAKYPHRVRSITLFAPVYITPQQDIPVCEALMKQWAPKAAWPPKDFALSFICHYYHLSRAFCFGLCAHHRFWEPPLTALLQALWPRRFPSSLIVDFMQHSHESAWHMFHNTIRGGAHVLEPALECLRCAGVPISVVHGRHDIVCPYESGEAMQARFGNVRFKGLPDANHVTVVMGREAQAAREVEAQVGRAEKQAR